MGLPKITIVGGRPPKEPDKSGTQPDGLERLVIIAASMQENVDEILKDPKGFAQRFGIVLDPREENILRFMEPGQFRMIVDGIKPRIPDRRRFLKQAAGILGILGAGFSMTPAAVLAMNEKTGDSGDRSKVTGGDQNLEKAIGILPASNGIPVWIPKNLTARISDSNLQQFPSVPANPPIYPTFTPGITPTPSSIPSITPTPSPSATLTPCPGITTTPTIPPTATLTPCPGITTTPTIAPTETLTPCPGITPTPEPDKLGAFIEMPSRFYYPHDLCFLKVHLCNPGEAKDNVPLFVLLQIGSMFFCAPEWTQLPDLSHFTVPLPNGWSEILVIGEFIWPTGVGSMDNLYFWAGMTDDNFTEALGYVDSYKFGYSE